MSIRVAIGSSDGKVINQHFGRAKQFLIFDVSDDVQFVELRQNVAACGDFQHDGNALSKSVEVISDCKAVFVSKIGGGAVQALASKGIKVFETPYIIEEVLENIKLKQKYI